MCSVWQLIYHCAQTLVLGTLSHSDDILLGQTDACKGGASTQTPPAPLCRQPSTRRDSSQPISMYWGQST